MAACWLRTPHPNPPLHGYELNKPDFRSQRSRILSLSDNRRLRLPAVLNFRNRRSRTRIYCNSDDSIKQQQPQSTGIQLYSDIERFCPLPFLLFVFSRSFFCALCYFYDYPYLLLDV